MRVAFIVVLAFGAGFGANELFRPRPPMKRATPITPSQRPVTITPVVERNPIPKPVQCDLSEQVRTLIRSEEEQRQSLQAKLSQERENLRCATEAFESGQVDVAQRLVDKILPDLHKKVPCWLSIDSKPTAAELRALGLQARRLELQIALNQIEMRALQAEQIVDPEQREEELRAVARQEHRVRNNLKTTERALAEPPSDKTALPELSTRQQVTVKLDSMKLSFQFNNMPVNEVAQYFGEVTGVNFVARFNPNMGVPLINLDVKDVPVSTTLRLIAESIGWSFEVNEDGMVILRPR